MSSLFAPPHPVSSMAFSIVNTYTLKVFGVRNLGKHAGFVRALSGAVVTTQIPLMSYIQHGLRGNFLPEHIGACVVMGVLILACVWIRTASKEESLLKGSDR